MNPKKAYNLRRRGVSPEAYEILYRRQKGKCAICLRCDDLLCWDHDHESGKGRGLLCRNCNLGLGNFRDSVALLAEAIDYLERSQDGVDDSSISMSASSQLASVYVVGPEFAYLLPAWYVDDPGAVVLQLQADGELHLVDKRTGLIRGYGTKIEPNEEGEVVELSGYKSRGESTDDRETRVADEGTVDEEISSTDPDLRGEDGI